MKSNADDIANPNFQNDYIYFTRRIRTNIKAARFIKKDNCYSFYVLSFVIFFLFFEDRI